MKKTILIISGGVLQDVVTNDPDMEFTIVDWDNIKEGCDIELYPETVKTDKQLDDYIEFLEEEVQKEHTKQDEL